LAEEDSEERNAKEPRSGTTFQENESYTPSSSSQGTSGLKVRTKFESKHPVRPKPSGSTASGAVPVGLPKVPIPEDKINHHSTSQGI